MKRKSNSAAKLKRNSKFKGDTETMISTGSTLLDLAISGGRVKGGGIPGGILVEIFGPSGSGKTVLLCEIAGSIKRAGGAVMFKDPEARLNRTFAEIFDLNLDEVDYDTPNTVPEVFKSVRNWEPESEGNINGIFADSLAALSTSMEMDNEEGDKMGTRRAKEFSEELRKTCRILTEKNYLMVATNQIRDKIGTVGFQQKWTTPGGKGMPFYASLRLRMLKTEKIKKEIRVHGKVVSRVTGVKTEIEVHKSSIWKPFRIAPLTIIFDYGIDDIRQNLQYVKDFTSKKTYTVGSIGLDNSMVKSIDMVEEQGLDTKLKKQVIRLWASIESKFDETRKSKRR